jgi:hypothetical protein
LDTHARFLSRFNLAGSHDGGSGICLGGQKNGYDLHSLYSHAARVEKEKKEKGSHEGLARYIEERWKLQVTSGPQKTLFITRRDKRGGGGGGGGGGGWGGAARGRGPPGFEAPPPPPRNGADDFVPLEEDNVGGTNTNAAGPPAKYVGWEGGQPYCALCRAVGRSGGSKRWDMAAVFQHARSTAEVGGYQVS